MHMQQVHADLTTRSETQTSCLQHIVVASGFPPFIAGAHCCAESKVWAALIKRYVWSPISHLVSTLLLWTMKGFKVWRPLHYSRTHMSMQWKTLRTQFCPHWKMWVLRPSPYTILLDSSPIKTWAQGQPSWTRAPAESEEGTEAPTHDPHVIHLGTGLPASGSRDTLFYLVQSHIATTLAHTLGFCYILEDTLD